MQENNSFIIADVNLFDGYKFVADGYVVVRRGLIAEVGCTNRDVPSEQDFPRFSRPGYTLIPGLIDTHIHAMPMPGDIHDCVEQSLRFGVTTNTQSTSDSQNKNKYADYKFSGIGAIIDGGWPIPVMKKGFSSHPHCDQLVHNIVSKWPLLKSPADAEPFVQLQVNKHGASYIKLFHELGDSLGMNDLPRPSMDIQKAVVEAAHKAGVIAVGHALSYAGAKDLFDAGVDGLTHCFLDKPPSDDFIDIMLTRNIHCNPTLVLCASQTVERQEWQREFRKDPLADRMMLPRKMYQAGITLVAGSDAGGQEFGVAYGLGMHIEMYLLKHEIGMTLEDVLKAATSNVAKRFGFNDRGEIAVGKKADFVLLKGDADSVLSDIQQRCLPVEGVWRDGVLANVYEERDWLNGIMINFSCIKLIIKYLYLIAKDYKINLLYF
ncbi:uncharacterized protein FOBCDRAFT_148509 [Fusarium oxysporum Fo47]|uniref:uncharacterized protein n=1 Tax=Fusarium oxysporum Fo47 TaxID=660027 RepID=UPI0028699CF3|nr:uncharacterized protein FOBCDRAFT_148509 [Fusarium oxysporum Fo47]QKD61320.2 hypothetical protein FOBCDRAFT_148509 [Fusarium oxysporum Fo47]